MPEDLGRVDWMPRKGVWRVIWYEGLKDVPMGDYATKEEADNALQALVESRKARSSVVDESRVREIVREEIRTEMPNDHELLLHFVIEKVGSPGVVLDEAMARATPCSCFTYKGKDLCWSKGIIGMLDSAQQDVYCVAGKAYKAQPKLVERYTTFAEAAEEAHKKIELMPPGRERLEVWLSAMGEELEKRGIEV